MRMWSVQVEVSHHDTIFTEDHVDKVMDALASQGPAVSYEPEAMAIRFCAEADSPGDASKIGLNLLRSALKEAGIKIQPASIVGYEIVDLEDLDP